jgi:hypothetical protein
VQVLFAKDNFWLTQQCISELFEVERSVITKHLRNIFKEGELDKDAVCAKFAHTAADGKTYNTGFYNLDAVIAAGYRVNTAKATQFRIWATNTLREYIVKGFVLNDKMLKNGRPFGKDYFDELLERIREIRASERRAYQKIADVFEQCSSDYQPNGEETVLFFKMVQNQLHFATTGKTAAEIVHERADSEKPYMGLTTWKNPPRARCSRAMLRLPELPESVGGIQAQPARNHVHRLCGTAGLEQAAHDHEGLVFQLRRFLDFNQQQILENAGKITHEMAVAKAHAEYEKFRVKQDADYLSDFDKDFERYLKGKPE